MGQYGSVIGIGVALLSCCVRKSTVDIIVTSLPLCSRNSNHGANAQSCIQWQNFHVEFVFWMSRAVRILIHYEQFSSLIVFYWRPQSFTINFPYYMTCYNNFDELNYCQAILIDQSNGFDWQNGLFLSLLWSGENDGARVQLCQLSVSGKWLLYFAQ